MFYLESSIVRSMKVVWRLYMYLHLCHCGFFFFQAEDGIRDLVRSRGLGDVYKRQQLGVSDGIRAHEQQVAQRRRQRPHAQQLQRAAQRLSLIHI